MFTGGFCHGNLLFCCFNLMIDSWISGAGTRYHQPILCCTDWLQMTSPEQSGSACSPPHIFASFVVGGKGNMSAIFIHDTKKESKDKSGNMLYLIVHRNIVIIL